MRVAHVVGSLPLPKSPKDSFVVRLSREQRLQNVSTEIIVANRKPLQRSLTVARHEVVDGVPIHRLRASPQDRQGILGAIEPFDVVHVHGPCRVAHYLGLTWFLHGKPLIFSNDPDSSEVDQPKRRGASWRPIAGYKRFFCDAEPGGEFDTSAKRKTKYMPFGDGKNFSDIATRMVDEYERIIGINERRILGVKIRSLSRQLCVAGIDRRYDAGHVQKICFANAHTLNIADRNPDFRDALRRFTVLNDGVGANIASLMKFGRPFVTNLNGTDFVPYLLASSRNRMRIFLLGAQADVVETAAQRFATAFPRHTVVGWRNGYFTGEQDIADTVEQIRTSRADCVLVAMGNPLQELWIDRYGGETGATLLIGVGALFDFEAGCVRRAPAWMRKCGCEWVYRFVNEPRQLFKRYMVGNFRFLGKVLMDARR